MNQQSDAQLLRAYFEGRSEAAFAELVRRHVDLVHSAARRMVCDAHLAEDVTQATFIALAKNAAQLTGRSVLSGWLHRTAQNIAAQTVRTDVRRRGREQEAATMNELLAAGSEAEWEQIAPHLDAALDELSEPDRDALLLRYFEGKSAREMAQTLGITDEASQKRVSRAVERLREFLAKRGVTVGASGLAAIVTANAVQAAPVGLALTISAAAALTGTTLATAATVTATKALAMTAFQKTIIAATITALAGVGVYEARQASQLREQNQTLQKKLVPLVEQNQQLQTDLNTANNRIIGLNEELATATKGKSELLKLRGQVGSLRSQTNDLAKLKNLAAQSNGEITAFSNAWVRSLTVSKDLRKQRALERLNRMKEQLNLTEEQFAAVSNLTMKQIEGDLHQLISSLSGDAVSNRKDASVASESMVESEIKAMLTPDQQAAYSGYKQSELNIAAENGANGQLANMSRYLNLSPEQKVKIREALIPYSLKESPFNDKEAIARARASGNFIEILNLQMEMEQQTLDDEVHILGSILTQEQLQAYKSQRIDSLNRNFGPLKSFLQSATKLQSAADGGSN